VAVSKFPALNFSHFTLVGKDHVHASRRLGRTGMCERIAFAVTALHSQLKPGRNHRTIVVRSAIHISLKKVDTGTGRNPADIVGLIQLGVLKVRCCYFTGTGYVVCKHKMP
jgi:hypothetical protein